jgi:hypothetical protein
MSERVKVVVSFYPDAERGDAEDAVRALLWRGVPYSLDYPIPYMVNYVVVERVSEPWSSATAPPDTGLMDALRRARGELPAGEQATPAAPPPPPLVFGTRRPPKSRKRKT